MVKDIDTQIPERCPRLTPRTHCKKMETVLRKLNHTFRIITGFPDVNLKVAYLNQN